MKTNRYSLPFAPEYPIEYVYSNDQVDGEWSFGGNPWMTGHTYKTTGYDPQGKCFVFAGRQYTYFFDPTKGKWERSAGIAPYRANFYVVTLCTTSHGVVAWADKPNGGEGLWLLDGKARVWKPLPLKGTLPVKSPDRHSLAYDAKRDRLLFFSNLGKEKGNVAAYDVKTGEAKWLDPAGRVKADVQCRETVYLPDLDRVLIGARLTGPDGKPRWASYDCAGNQWQTLELPGDDPIARGSFNNSMGLMYDPQRKLVWAVGQHSHVHVLKLEPAALRFHLLDE